MVEWRNEARQQWMGRMSQNKTVNFTGPADVELQPGSYVSVRVTTAFPNSLVGELV
jgi:tRNA-2-methylthio-N6-dimethylallyladenosine synthase